MKSFWTVLFSVFCVALCGCGSASNQKLVVATNAEFPPYEYYDGDQVVGIDIEICRAIGEDLGMEVEIEDMAFDSIIAAVSSGKADIGIAGLTITEDRLKNINFSNPYTNAAQVIVVKEGSTVASPDDLSGKTVGVQLGTTSDIYSEDIDDATVERYSKSSEAIQALVQDKVDAVMLDRQPAIVFVSQNAGLKIVDEEFTVEDYAIAIAKGNTELLDKINGSLEKLQSSGKLQEIIDKYITTN